MPLLGHNLVRLLYLDEAGTDHGASTLLVAGVLVHGDFEWPEIDRRIRALIEKYIPAIDRFGFAVLERLPGRVVGARPEI